MNTTQTEITWLLSKWTDLDIDTLYKILQLRQSIFIVEQNCPYLDADGLDPATFHLMGYADEQLCAYARIFPPKENRIAIGRVIVAPSFRGQGLGYLLMKEAHQQAQRIFGVQRFFVSAQQHLAHFYQNLGYKICGNPYLEDNIPHVPMNCG